MQKDLSESSPEMGKIEEIYLKYRDLMLFIADRILGDTKESEDVVHQTMVKLMEIADGIGEAGSPRTKALVATVTERTAVDLYRRRRRRTAVPFDEEFVQIADTAPLDAAAERTDLAAAMARLPARFREVLLLRYDGGYNCGEIAGLLSMSQANVRKTIQRAKERLEAELTEGGSEIP